VEEEGTEDVHMAKCWTFIKEGGRTKGKIIDRSEETALIFEFPCITSL